MTRPMPPRKQLTVDMQPVGRRIDIDPGTNLLEAAQDAGVGLVTLCGGEGWCESCRVRVTDGEVNPPTKSEIDFLGQAALAAGYRLGCQTVPKTNIRIDIPPESLSTPQRLQIEGRDFVVSLAPNIQALDLELTPPSMEDLRADAERVVDALAEQGFPAVKLALPVLRDLSIVLRENKWSARFVLQGREVIAVLPSETRLFGVAADIGTTKVALYLVDLQTGETVAKVGEMNPQIAYGEDIVSRISYAIREPDGRRVLQSILVDVINKKVAEVCETASIKPEQILDAVIVGNTAMHHLLAGLPVEQLVFAPYVPAVSAPMDLPAREIGLQISPGANLHLLPNIAGYVGADHAAVILSAELSKAEGTVLAIDIGTNTEISLAANGRLLSCSCASGPAFEGAHITNGMRAAPGAIERVQIIDGEIRTFTIDDQLPVGICGSGILDVVAEMKSADVMDERGALQAGKLNVREGTKPWSLSWCRPWARVTAAISPSPAKTSTRSSWPKPPSGPGRRS